MREDWQDEDERRLSQNPEFILACQLIVKGLQETKMDFDKVHKIDWPWQKAEKL